MKRVTDFTELLKDKVEEKNSWNPLPAPKPSLMPCRCLSRSLLMHSQEEDQDCPDRLKENGVMILLLNLKGDNVFG